MLTPKSATNIAYSEEVWRQRKGAIASANSLEKIAEFITTHSGYSCSIATDLYFPLRVMTRHGEIIAGVRMNYGKWMSKLIFDESLVDLAIDKESLEALMQRAVNHGNK